MYTLHDNIVFIWALISFMLKPNFSAYYMEWDVPTQISNAKFLNTDMFME